VKELIVNPT